MAVGQNPGEHQNRWYMGVHAPQNGAIGYDPLEPSKLTLALLASASHLELSCELATTLLAATGVIVCE